MAMPPAAEDKKTLLIMLFTSLIQGSFFQRQFVNLTEFFNSIPQAPWSSGSTPSSTREMMKAEERQLGSNILLRVMELISGELKAIEGSPLKIPKTMEDITDARSEESKHARIAWVQALLMKPGVRSDGWLKLIFNDFSDVLDIDSMLDPRDKLRLRKHMAKTVAQGANAVFGAMLGTVYLSMEDKVPMNRSLLERVCSAIGL